MGNIIRNEPVQELARLEPFRDLEGFFGWPRSLRRFLQDIPAEPTMKLDVSETEAAYTVKAELPGVKKEDIKVEVEGNQVSVSAEVKRETEEKKGETVLHSERYYGKQYRSFTLGHEIDRKNVKAKFDNGVLELMLPKSGGSEMPPISIE